MVNTFMRIKATDSLAKLKKMRNKRRKHVPFSEVDETTWTRCEGTISIKNYIGMISWANKNCAKMYSRTNRWFWFEDEKDAFKFKLKYGNQND